MNAKVWSNTRSNVLNFHAFPEGNAECNSRIAPNDGGTFLTADMAKSQPMSHLCERCVKKMAAREAATQRKAEREANGPRPVEAQDVATIGDATGRVLYEGNTNTHKRPQGFPQVITIEPAGKGMWSLKGEDGKVFKRVRGTTRLWLRPCPANIDEIREAARAEAEAIADSIELVPVEAPIAAAEKIAGEPAHVANEDQDQDVTLSAQDIVDAELGACEFAPLEDIELSPEAKADAKRERKAYAAHKRGQAEADQGARYVVGQTVDYVRGGDVPASIPNGRVEVTRVVDHGPEAAHRAPGRFTYVVRVPGIPQATQGASEGELSAVEGVAQLDPQAVTAEQAEAQREADAQGTQAEAEAREAARQRLEALRAPEVETEAEHVGTHRNVSYMITMAPNEKARASWQRVALASWLAAQVKAHAQANAANGWDVVTETLSDGELNVLMLECAPQSTEEAISYVRSLMVESRREREADALISAWGEALDTAPDGKAEEVTVTDAMVRQIEKATVFEHGTEISGHASMLRAMEQQGLIRQHAAGGTLTDRGMWLRGYLMAGGEGRNFRADEMHD